jgi:uncharacterized protein
MDHLDNLEYDLKCPVTLDFFEEPIRVPCCKRFFSKVGLVGSLEQNQLCPHCKADLSEFDAKLAEVDMTIVNLVESFLGAKQQVKIIESVPQEWSVSISPVKDRAGQEFGVGQLQISLEKSQFTVKPTLLIAIIDTSGSMLEAFSQVKTALSYMVSISETNPNVNIVLIPYSHCATIVPLTNDSVENKLIVDALKVGGGTCFKKAFEKLQTVLKSYTCSDDADAVGKPNNVGSATVVFLTDGCDYDSNMTKDQLVMMLRDIVNESWHGPITIHSVGFCQNCDKNLLEDIRVSGNIEGVFRYAEPGKLDDDTLCHKLQALFSVVTEGSSVKLTVDLGPNKLTTIDGSDQITIQFAVDQNQRGTNAMWIRGDFQSSTSIRISSPLEENSELAVETKMGDNKLYDRWLSYQTDRIAVELLEVCKMNRKDGETVYEISIALIQNKIQALIASTTDVNLIQRLDTISEQVDRMLQGVDANIGILSDLRFGSKFAAIESSNKPKVTQIGDVPQHMKPLPIKEKAEYTERNVHYSFNNDGKDRNVIGSLIMSISPKTKQIIEKYQSVLEYLNGNYPADHPNKAGEPMVTFEDMLHRDVNGNTPLMLASYAGHVLVVDEILKKFSTQLDLSQTNNDGETAITLAIKKKGYWKIMQSLLKNGATIPENRKKPLEQFAISTDRKKTAKMIASISADVKEAYPTMEPAYIQFMYDIAMEKGININVNSYLVSTLANCMYDLLHKLLNTHGAMPTVQQVNEYCIPPKPDDPQTNKYLTLAKIILDHSPHLINEVDEQKESPLFKAAEKGSLPHVILFLERGAIVDKPNILGNTPLWIACAKAYPCIIEELVNAGADVNWTNNDQNVPLYSVCRKGPAKIAKFLLSQCAKVDKLNGNQDTLLLICCRNGQHETLELCLKLVDPEFVDFKAHIDGFNCVFASTEGNRPECIRVLHEYGADFEQTTDATNKILPNATPLHLAAFYKRVDACNALLSIGVNRNPVDHNLQTPLHIAVIQGCIPIIKALIFAGADITCRDILGNTPAAYCRTNYEIRRLLVNPLLDPLIRLAHGVPKEEEQKVIEILQKRSFIEGCLNSCSIVNFQTTSGTTALTEAIIHSNYNIAQLMMQLGANPTIRNFHGNSPYVWAKWINNPRIIKLLPADQESEKDVDDAIKRLRKTQKNSINSQIIFLVDVPKQLETLKASGIEYRMVEYLNVRILVNDQAEEDVISIDEESCTAVSSGIGAVGAKGSTSIFDRTEFLDPKYQNLIWNAKVHTTSVVAGGEAFLTNEQIFAICMFTNNPYFGTALNNAIAHREKEKLEIYNPFIDKFNTALRMLPNYQGEIYIGSPSVDRTLFQIGTEFSWPTVRSASTMWRVAMSPVEDFATNKRVGTIFVIKTRTSKLIIQYSQFSYDGEVLIVPNTPFRVTNWYRGDVIALGQDNIREHTFKLKDDEKAALIHSEKSLIIELTEL